MDLLLSVADDWAFDWMWARLVPLSAFQQPTKSALASNTTASTSTWAQLVSHLPRPELRHEDLLLLHSHSSAFNSTTSAFPSISAWPRTYLPRQTLSLFLFTLVGIHLLYFIFAGLSYYFIFNHDMMRHPRFLKNQVRMEIQSSLKAFPWMILLTLPIFVAEVRGHTMMYDGLETYGLVYLVASVPFYLLFTDYLIYWVHRGLHHPTVYKYIHKPHHKWLIPTPFASHAFHPVDGFAQSLPYHLFIFLFPIHRTLYIVLFVLVNFWSIFIHDSDMITGHIFEKAINGPAHHTLHHLYYTVNYGQYFTWADRVGGSYRQPMSDLDPMLEVKALDEANRRKEAGKGKAE